MAPAQVRLAGIADEDEIMDLCRLLHAETGLEGMDDILVLEMLRPALAHQSGVCGVIEGAGGIEGCILLKPDRYWYRHKWHLLELFNFVRADRRSSRHARTLVEYAKSVSDQLKLPLVIGILSNIKTGQKIRLYQRIFGNPAGVIFFHGADWANVDGEGAAQEFWDHPFPRRGVTVVHTNGWDKDRLDALSQLMNPPKKAD